MVGNVTQSHQLQWITRLQEALPNCLASYDLHFMDWEKPSTSPQLFQASKSPASSDWYFSAEQSFKFALLKFGDFINSSTTLVRSIWGDNMWKRKEKKNLIAAAIWVTASHDKLYYQSLMAISVVVWTGSISPTDFLVLLQLLVQPFKYLVPSKLWATFIIFFVWGFKFGPLTL